MYKCYKAKALALLSTAKQGNNVLGSVPGGVTPYI